MMKKIFLVFSAISLSNFVFSQKDSSIEIKLKIIEEIKTTEGKILKGLALSISLF